MIRQVGRIGSSLCYDLTALRGYVDKIRDTGPTWMKSPPERIGVIREEMG